uniref:DDB1- and CUL4-associated factor 5 n=1 Tax=Petromyzon marinus TaxID=7757 RepID=A0AAJ7U5E7_PETMA|nr:DDB1- and CUL4-associated factor 5 [Petromyzon marinus]
MLGAVRFVERRRRAGGEEAAALRRRLQASRLARARGLFHRELRGHFGCVNAVEFSCGAGSWLVSGGDDRRVLLWDVERAVHGMGQPVPMTGEHHSNIFCLAFTSDNKRIFSAGNDEQVILHDAERGDTVDVFPHEEAVYGLSVSPDNDCVFASSSDEGRVLIWDTRISHHEEPFCLANYRSPFHGVMFNPVESRLVATANSKEGVGLWDVRKPRSCLWSYGGDGGPASAMSVRFDASGGRLVALRRRLPPVLFDVRHTRPLCHFQHPGYYNSCTMKSCCFAGDRDQYVLSGSDDFNLYMWRIPDEPIQEAERTVPRAFLVLKGHRSIVNQVRFNNNTHMLCSSGVEKVIKVWSPFVQPGSRGDLSGEAQEPRRAMYTHEEYIGLVLSSGSALSHDYGQQSLDEDPRMMAFFDSLVQREVDGWSSASDSDASPGALAWVPRGAAAERSPLTGVLVPLDEWERQPRDPRPLHPPRIPRGAVPSAAAPRGTTTSTGSNDGGAGGTDNNNAGSGNGRGGTRRRWRRRRAADVSPDTSDDDGGGGGGGERRTPDADQNDDDDGRKNGGGDGARDSGESGESGEDRRASTRRRNAARTRARKQRSRRHPPDGGAAAAAAAASLSSESGGAGGGAGPAASSSSSSDTSARFGDGAAEARKVFRVYNKICNSYRRHLRKGRQQQPQPQQQQQEEEEERRAVAGDAEEDGTGEWILIRGPYHDDVDDDVDDDVGSNRPARQTPTCSWLTDEEEEEEAGGSAASGKRRATDKTSSSASTMSSSSSGFDEARGTTSRRRRLTNGKAAAPASSSSPSSSSSSAAAVASSSQASSSSSSPTSSRASSSLSRSSSSGDGRRRGRHCRRVTESDEEEEEEEETKRNGDFGARDGSGGGGGGGGDVVHSASARASKRRHEEEDEEETDAGEEVVEEVGNEKEAASPEPGGKRKQKRQR